MPGIVSAVQRNSYRDCLARDVPFKGSGKRHFSPRPLLPGFLPSTSTHSCNRLAEALARHMFQNKSFGVTEYNIDQTDGMQKLLNEFGMAEGTVNSSPMPNTDLLHSDSTVLDESESAWCKAVLGKLHYFVRTCRWDIAAAVSLVLNSTDSLQLV